MAEPFGPRPPIAATSQMELVVYDPATPNQPQKIDPKAASTGNLIAQTLTNAGLLPVAGPSVAGLLQDVHAAIAAIRGVTYTPTTVEGDIAAIGDGLVDISQSVAAIAAEIEAKGIPVGDTPLSGFPALIRAIQGGGPVSEIPQIASVSIVPSGGLVGDTLEAVAVVTGTPAPVLTYQWIEGADDIPGATSRFYTTTFATDDLRVRVTASNTHGTATATSAAVTVATEAASGTYVLPDYVLSGYVE